MPRKCPVSGRVCEFEGTLACEVQQLKHHWKVFKAELFGRSYYPYRIKCSVKYPDRK